MRPILKTPCLAIANRRAPALAGAAALAVALAAALLAGCGGRAEPARNPFAAAVPPPAAPAQAVAAVAAEATVASGYDFASGLLRLRQLALAGSGTCYDVDLRTVSTSPIRVELGAVAEAACAAANTLVARYDGSARTLSLPLLQVQGGGCYAAQLRTVSDTPLQLELTRADTTACTSSSFALTSAVAAEGGALPTEYTCDGPGSSPPLAWSGAPAGTRQFALLMTTLPGDGSTKWNWVLWNIPAAATSLARDAFGAGTAGVGSDGPLAGYQAPCSQGPGAKRYTWTLVALSGAPVLSGPAERVTGADLEAAIAPLTLARASLNLTYTRSAASPGSSEACLRVRSSLAAGGGTATAGCDERYAYVGGAQLAAHTMMDGITATNLQVPVAQAFFGANAWKIPLAPALAASPVSAVDGPIGVAVNGVPLFNPCKQGGCQNGDTKVLGELDVCNGHAGRADDYHYHAAPVCLMATKPASYWDTHPLGWALDGFAIFGYRDADGSPAVRDSVCGGNTKAVPNAPAGYAYHVTDASPYVLSCFRGTPSPDLAGQGAKYSPLRKPPVTPFAVSGMTLATDAATGAQVLQFSTARSFTSTGTGTDSYAYPAGTYRISYSRVTGDELQALLAEPAQRGRQACWRFQFSSSLGATTQPAMTYCR